MNGIDREKVKRLAKITIECLDEHIPVRGNAMASGDDEEDFRAKGGYFEDMVDRAVDDLCEQLESLARTINALSA